MQSATGGTQQPWVSSSPIAGAFFFAGAPAATPAAAAPTGPAPDEATWSFVKDTKDPDQLRRFIEQFPASARRSEAAARLLTLEQAKVAAVPAVAPLAEPTVQIPKPPAVVTPRSVPRTLTGHTNTVAGVAFSPNGNWIASASHDRTIRVWDAATGRLVRTLQGAHQHPVFAVAFSRNNRLLLTHGIGATQLWEVGSWKSIRAFTDSDLTGQRCATFSPDGRHFVADWPFTLKLREVQTGEANPNIRYE